MEPAIILQGMILDDFFKEINTIVKKKLEERITELDLSAKAERYLTPKEVAAQLKVSTVTVATWTKQGRLKSYRIGSKVRYKATEVEEGLVQRRFIKYY